MPSTSPKQSISAIVLTKNEEPVITRCLKSLQWCDEIIVIDDNSVDKTVFIAKRLGAKVYFRNLNNNFAAQRNFAMKKAKHQWLLYVDADEVVDDELMRSIKRTLKNPTYHAYFLQRVNIFMGKQLSFREAGDTHLVRLVQKGSGKWHRKVHEVWNTKHLVGKLRGKLLHFSIDTVGELIEKIRTYSTLHAQEVAREKKRVVFFKVILYPSLKFMKSYILENGYRDGPRGFILCVGMSFHSFLSWSKLCLEKR